MNQLERFNLLQQRHSVSMRTERVDDTVITYLSLAGFNNIAYKKVFDNGGVVYRFMQQAREMF